MAGKKEEEETEDVVPAPVKRNSKDLQWKRAIEGMTTPVKERSNILPQQGENTASQVSIQIYF
jgi:hypothetical protein